MTWKFYGLCIFYSDAVFRWDGKNGITFYWYGFFGLCLSGVMLAIFYLKINEREKSYLKKLMKPMKKSEAGKGHTPRKVNKALYDENFDRIKGFDFTPDWKRKTEE